ncbi:MAG: hypothetical protein EOM23_08815, partial [Candidatus Moranbacteria bacterium]|nr:hypothetical protein [Candidatus Moranbacteria bacterium]
LKTSVKAVGSSPISKAYLVFNSIQTEGVCTVIPALEIRNIEDEEALKLCGAGIFVKDKLQCCIDEFQTKSLSFINNKIKTGLLTIKISDQSNQFISYEIYKSKTKRELLFEEDVLSVNIIVETTVIIGEVETKADFTKTQEIEKIRQLLKKNLEEDLSRLIDTAQVKMKCDIFGIGPQINRNYPEMWEKYKDDWDEIFKKLKINVECRIKINGSGISNKTAMGLEK